MLRSTVLAFGLGAYVLVFLPFLYPVDVFASLLQTCPSAQAFEASAPTPCEHAPGLALNIGVGS
jgi:hypothetical protein